MKRAISDNFLIKFALAYSDNIGFEETMYLYQHGDEEQIKAFEQLLANEDYESAWKLLKEVTKTNLASF